MDPMSLENLDSLLNKWEWAEYISAAVVILGAVGEFMAEFTTIFRQEHSKKRLAKVATIVLIGGLAVELVALVRTSQLSGQIIALLNQKASQADDRASQANERASQASERAANSERLSEELKKENLILQASVTKVQKTLSWRTLQ